MRDSIDELAYWMPWCSPNYAIEDANRWIAFTLEAWSSEREYPLGIFDATTDDVIGGTSINHINNAYRIGNMGYWVSSRFTGRGVARFAAREAAMTLA